MAPVGEERSRQRRLRMGFDGSGEGKGGHCCLRGCISVSVCKAFPDVANIL